MPTPTATELDDWEEIDKKKLKKERAKENHANRKNKQRQENFVLIDTQPNISAEQLAARDRIKAEKLAAQQREAAEKLTVKASTAEKESAAAKQENERKAKAQLQRQEIFSTKRNQFLLTALLTSSATGQATPRLYDRERPAAFALYAPKPTSQTQGRRQPLQQPQTRKSKRR